MRCNICDNKLSEEEIKFEEDYGRYAPCRNCINESPTMDKFISELETLEALANSEENIDYDYDESDASKEETRLS